MNPKRVTQQAAMNTPGPVQELIKVLMAWHCRQTGRKSH